MLKTLPYRAQKRGWPSRGRHILANYDAETMVVYQAYRPSIGLFAAREQFFGGEFLLSRMSWVKPNFLWMMYRSGWGTKPGQEVTLAVRVRRSFFDEVLGKAIHSSYVPEVYESEQTWRRLGSATDVRLQWDPDHGPKGGPCARRALQLGLRGETLALYARDAIVEVEDISAFVAEQRERLGDLDSLQTPQEEVYPVTDEGVRSHLGLDPWPEVDAV